MLEGYRDGKFAIGLLVGVCTTVIFFAFDSLAINPAAQSISDCTGSANDCADNSEQVPNGLYWLRRAFAIEDTLAQWIMMTFTVIAAFLLLGTLKSTREMTVASRAIGEAQTRPWLVASGTDVVKVTRLNVLGQDYAKAFGIRVNLDNFGNTPAINTFICVTNISIPRDAPIPHFEIPAGSAKTVIGPSTKFHSAHQIMWGDKLRDFLEGKTDFIVYVRLDYQGLESALSHYHTEATFRVRHDGNNADGDPEMPAYADGPQNSVS